jgi:hypothetical protein
MLGYWDVQDARTTITFGTSAVFLPYYIFFRSENILGAE